MIEASALRFGEVSDEVRPPIAVTHDSNADHLIPPDARTLGESTSTRRILGATDNPGRHAGNNRVVRNVARHDRSGAHQRALADGHAGQDGGIAADRGVARLTVIGTTLQSAVRLKRPVGVTARG